jgi:hypothetical protein
MRLVRGSNGNNRGRFYWEKGAMGTALMLDERDETVIVVCIYMQFKL